MGQAGSNSLHVQTDQPTYVAGQSVTGKVFLSNASPINSRGIFLKVQGYEKVRFVEHKTRQVRDGEHMRTETYEVERKNKRVFFNQTFPVYTWQGPIPPGQYTFPFNFQLPVQLPGVYWENTTHGRTPYEARIRYKVKATVDCTGFMSSNINAFQDLVVHESNPALMQPLYRDERRNITFLCCVSKGHAQVRVHLDKGCYTPGEEAQVVCELNNQSSVELQRLRTKFMRRLRLNDGRGNSFQFQEEISRADFPGVAPMTQCMGESARFVPVRLVSRSGSAVLPQTNGQFVRTEYWVELVMGVPWSPDVRIQVPVSVVAPPPPASAFYTAPPPGWAPQIMPTQTFALSFS